MRSRNNQLMFSGFAFVLLLSSRIGCHEFGIVVDAHIAEVVASSIPATAPSCSGDYACKKARKSDTARTSKLMVSSSLRVKGGSTPQPSTTTISSSTSKPTTSSAAGSATTAKYNLQSTLKSINSLTSSSATKLHNALPNLLCESALMDKETNRIYWQGGSEILSTSLTKPYLTQRGVSHVRATILFALIWLWVWGKVSRYWTFRYFESQQVLGDNANSLQGHTSLLFSIPFVKSLQNLLLGENPPPPIIQKIISIISPILQFVVLLLQSLLYVRLPPYSPRIIFATIVLYLIESYNCSTRRYLSHAMNAPQEIQSYLEQLRSLEPVVKWKVRCFHYEDRELLGRYCRWMYGIWDTCINKTGDPGAGQDGASSGNDAGSKSKETAQFAPKNSNNTNLSKFGESPPSWMARKVVTHEAVGSYKFGSWEDHTLATLWKRSETFTLSHEAPFTKLALSKLLVLKDQKAREDYFAQQAAFVMLEGRKDVFAEFATNIEVEGFRPKLLAVRPMRHAATSAAIFRLHIYILFTLLGLSLPYRIWFAKHCDEIRVTVVKETSESMILNKEEDNSMDGKSSWFRGKWGWGSPASSAALESKKAQELFRKNMQSFSLYEEETFEKQDGSTIEKRVSLPEPDAGVEEVTINDHINEVDQPGESTSINNIEDRDGNVFISDKQINPLVVDNNSIENESDVVGVSDSPPPPPHPPPPHDQIESLAENNEISGDKAPSNSQDNVA